MDLANNHYTIHYSDTTIIQQIHIGSQFLSKLQLSLSAIHAPVFIDCCCMSLIMSMAKMTFATAMSFIDKQNY